MRMSSKEKEVFKKKGKQGIAKNRMGLENQ
jgi:hypothetical protein